MSNRLKKKRKPKKAKWMTMDEFRRKYEQGRVGPKFQRSGCQTTGEMFVRPITGRFKNKSEEELRQIVDDICQIFIRAGHPPVLDPEAPLWTQAEFLDNMLEFEMNPPCGCESEIKDVIKSA
jgi:hypothetical protein